MGERKLIKIETENYILTESIVDSNGDTTWDIKDPKTCNSFVVHSFSSGKMYITFFKRCHITSSCSFNALKKICEIMLERDLKPTINIYYKNTQLIKLCCALGFRKDKRVKHLYYLKSLK